MIVPYANNQYKSLRSDPDASERKWGNTLNQTIDDILAKVFQEMRSQVGFDWPLSELTPVRIGQRIFDEKSIQAFRAGDITYIKRRADNKDFVYAWSTRLGHMTQIPVKTFRVLKVPT